MTTLIALHGFTQNATQLSAHLQPLLARLPGHVQPLIPDAPHPCSEAGLKRLRRILGTESMPPPNLCWWDATDDGREYRGWEVSRDRLHALAARGPVGLLGFSQGGIVSAVISALAERGEFPALRFAVIVAGKKPRALALTPLLDTPLQLPSLHVWGTRDPFSADSEHLVDSFAPERREVVRWDGPHVLPTYGPAADAIVDFVTRHAGP